MILTATELSSIAQNQQFRYSICTLVTNLWEYNEMISSFNCAGFGEANSEFLFADNSDGNRYDGYSAINRFLRIARGEYVIICHQDIRLHYDDIKILDKRLEDLTLSDPLWAVAGNAGGVAPGLLAIRITDPHGVDTNLGPFPALVDGLDENFIVIKRAAGLSVSSDLNGFHFYGTDLCLIAKILGYSCYVIDFHLLHIGGGSQPGKKSNLVFRSDYPESKRRFINKYSRVFSARWIQNTGGTIFISGSSLLCYLGNRKLFLSLARRFFRTRYNRLVRDSPRPV